jgi:hypothetical protein
LEDKGVKVEMIIKTWKQRLGPWAAGIIIGVIVFVFIFSGVFSRSSTKGNHESAVAGTVDGEPISRQMYLREFNRQIEFYKQLMGGKMTETQAKQLGLGRRVFNDLAQRQVMVNAATRLGRLPSDAEVRDSLVLDTTFHENGRFDALLYKRILQANHLTPAQFEKMIRDDLAVQSWVRFFETRVHVSENELKDEFLNLKEKRKLGYVVISPEWILEKNKKLKTSKDQPEYSEEVRKLQESLASELVASGAKVTTLAKSKGLNPQSSGFLPRMASMIPGITDPSEILRDAFSSQMSLNQPKIYRSAGSWIVAWVEAKETADLSKLESEKSALRESVRTRKARILQGEWLEKQMAQSKIVVNEDIVGPPLLGSR